jgi:G protein-coupled receptor GPR1
VAYKFRGFGEGDGQAKRTRTNSSLGNSRRTKRYDLPPTPPLAYNGLIPASTNGSDGAQDSEDPSRATIESEKSTNQPTNGATASWRWKDARLSLPASEGQLPQRSETDDPLQSHTSLQQLNTTSNASQPPDLETQNSFTPPTKAVQPNSSHLTSFKSRRSIMGLAAFLRSHRQSPDEESQPTTPISQLELVNSNGGNLAVTRMAQQRDKIQKQLRFLFIYPLVYIGMWVLPFVGHVMQYSDRYALDPPFALNAIINIMVTSQCAVDCWLFSTREKPWRHIPASKGGFWESFLFWRNGSKTSNEKRTKGPGRNRAEMQADARAAYRRRDEELAERESATANGGLRRERSWWDGERSLAFDGTMSPVTEEENPMEGSPRSSSPVSEISEEGIAEKKRPGNQST